MEYELKSMAEIKPSRVLPMLGRTWAKGLALASSALIAAGCSTSDTSQSLSVDAVMDVCAKNDCFTVKVPANLSVTVNGHEVSIPSSNGSGTVALESVGAVQVTARWNSFEKTADLMISDGSAESVTIKFDEIARVTEL